MYSDPREFELEGRLYEAKTMYNLGTLTKDQYVAELKSISQGWDDLAEESKRNAWIFGIGSAVFIGAIVVAGFVVGIT